MFNRWQKIAIISETVLYSSIIIQGLIYLSYPSLPITNSKQTQKYIWPKDKYIKKTASIY